MERPTFSFEVYKQYRSEEAERASRARGELGQLSPRTFWMLIRAGYTSAQGLRAATDDELLSIRQLGAVRLREIREAVGRADGVDGKPEWRDAHGLGVRIHWHKSSMIFDCPCGAREFVLGGEETVCEDCGRRYRLRCQVVDFGRGPVVPQAESNSGASRIESGDEHADLSLPGQSRSSY